MTADSLPKEWGSAAGRDPHACLVHTDISSGHAGGLPVLPGQRSQDGGMRLPRDTLQSHM